MEHLSDIELYYSSQDNISGNTILLCGEELRHATKVMRNRVGDIIFLTNGTGSIFKAEISDIDNEKLSARIIDKFFAENKLQNIFFCIPKLKNPERFRFALEKCVELGVVNFIVFESERTISKRSNVKRWENIALSAMKQSIRGYLPNIKIMNSVTEIKNLSGIKIVLDQNAPNGFCFKNQNDKKYYFVFGPEGGLSDSELKLFGTDKLFNISENRLRSETAIVKVASLL